MEKNREEILQNLKDAGCGPEEIACFMDCIHKDDREEGLDILMRHRKKLMDDIHQIRGGVDPWEMMAEAQNRKAGCPCHGKEPSRDGSCIRLARIRGCYFRTIPEAVHGADVAAWHGTGEGSSWKWGGSFRIRPDV